MTRPEEPRDPRRVREEAVDWLLRMEDADAAAADEPAFAAWLRRDPSHAAEFDRVRALYGDSGRALRKDPRRTRRAIRTKAGSRTAFGLIAGLAVLGVAFVAADGPIRMRADVMSGSEAMPVVRLSDGSRIQLNARSAIAEEFDAGARTVVLLRGEAYFEVAKEVRPFVVEAGGGRVEARGTAFDVNRVGGGVEVTVTESRVAVAGAKAGEIVLLEPGMRVAYDGSGALGAVEQVPEGAEASWRSGRMVFEERPMALVVEEIFRHLPGRALIADETMRHRRISGSFDITGPEDALASFSAAFGLRVLRAGPFLTILY